MNVMLEDGQGPKRLAKRKATYSLFALLTPRCCKKARPHSRLYGFLNISFRGEDDSTWGCVLKVAAISKDDLVEVVRPLVVKILDVQEVLP
jgi:hypothetical protein